MIKTQGLERSPETGAGGVVVSVGGKTSPGTPVDPPLVTGTEPVSPHVGSGAGGVGTEVTCGGEGAGGIGLMGVGTATVAI
jgi:hypothetical protein